MHAHRSYILFQTKDSEEITYYRMEEMGVELLESLLTSLTNTLPLTADKEISNSLNGVSFHQF